MATEDQKGKLAKILYEIFREEDELAIFHNSISMGRYTPAGRFIPTSKLVFRIGDNQDNSSESIFDPAYHEKYCIIKIVPFTLKTLKSKAILQSGRDQTMFKKLFGAGFVSFKTHGRLGLNLSKTVKVKGYVVNFTDVKKLMLEDQTHGDLIERVNEFFYVGTKNALLALSTTNGELIIREQAIMKLVDGNDHAAAKEAIKNLIVMFSKYNAVQSQLSIKDYKEIVTDTLTNNAINRLIDEHLHQLPIDMDDESQKAFLKRIKETVERAVDKKLKDSVFGVKDTYSYATLINSMFADLRNRRQTDYKEGFHKGMEMGMKFEMAGWVPDSEAFIDESDSTAMWWSKTVDIIPDMFVYGQRRYLIPESERQWKITKIFISQGGSMRCHGNHPNVQGTKVCMGDLKINWSGTISEIKESLDRAEDLLDLINYDSAYDNTKREHLMQVSTLVDDISDIGHSQKHSDGDSSAIQEIDGNMFVDDDDDEEDGDYDYEEEIVQESSDESEEDVEEEPEVFKRVVEVAEVEEGDRVFVERSSLEPATLAEIRTGAQEDMEDPLTHLESIETDEVSGIVETDLASDISRVDQNSGTITPVVFTVPPISNEIESDTPIEVAYTGTRLNELFTLGDTNTNAANSNT